MLAVEWGNSENFRLLVYVPWPLGDENKTPHATEKTMTKIEQAKAKAVAAFKRHESRTTDTLLEPGLVADRVASFVEGFDAAVKSLGTVR